MRKRELDVGVVELGDVGTLAVLGSNLLKIDNLDASSTSSVSASHVHVELVDGSNASGITELLVQVVGSRSTVVTDEGTVVLHDLRALLVNLVDGENLSGGLLHLVVFTQEIPEARLGDDIVGSEDSHAVQGRVGGVLSRSETTDNLILEESHHRS